MTKEEAIRILYEMLSKTFNGGGELGGLAVQMAVEALRKQEEPVSEDLGEYISELSKQFPEVSFAKLSRIAVRVAKWQKQKEINEIRAEIKKRYEHHLGCMEGSRDDTYPEISHAHHRVIKDELFEILCFLDVLEGKSDVSEANFGKISKD